MDSVTTGAGVAAYTAVATENARYPTSRKTVIAKRPWPHLFTGASGSPAAEPGLHLRHRPRRRNDPAPNSVDIAVNAQRTHDRPGSCRRRLDNVGSSRSRI